MKEIWKDIPGYESVYQVSNLGRVRSLGRWILGSGRGFPRFLKGRILYQHQNKGGYKTISMMKDGEHKTLLVHRIVAEVFLPNPNDYPDINHIDGVKDNNVLTNIEWCTHKENMKHAYAHGLVGYNNPQNKKRVIITDIHGESKEFECIEYAAQHIGICSSSVSRACSGERPHAGGYKCKYANEIR